MARRIAMYFAWDREAETAAPLGVLDNRFPALHEVRRQFWPAFEALAEAPGGQGIEGFLQGFFLRNFARFGDQVATLTGRPLRQVQRRSAVGETLLDAALLDAVDTLIVISFDSQRTGQAASVAEVDAVRAFLARPDTMLFVCPHHDIGDTDGLDADAARARLEAEFHHHGDAALPGQQRVGGFGRSLMAGLGAPIRNRFGLRPARTEQGEPVAFDRVAEDRYGILAGVPHFNLHPHLPHYERVGAGTEALEVLARVPVQSDAPAHPEAPAGGKFDAMLQARPEAALGRLLVCDVTLWTSAFGGLQGLQALWRNVIAA
ncbi:MAG TPA: hypothetical protein VHN39_01905 [Phenylobacterium sp.]|nr:hypothetical protein [Phenylobacterium sp.]